MKEFRDYCIIALLLLAVGIATPLVALAQAADQPVAEDALYLVISRRPEALVNSIHQNGGTVIGGLQSRWSMLVAGDKAVTAGAVADRAWFVIPAAALARLCGTNDNRTPTT